MIQPCLRGHIVRLRLGSDVPEHIAPLRRLILKYSFSNWWFHGIGSSWIGNFGEARRGRSIWRGIPHSERWKQSFQKFNIAHQSMASNHSTFIFVKQLIIPRNWIQLDIAKQCMGLLFKKIIFLPSSSLPSSRSIQVWALAIGCKKSILAQIWKFC